ncbi:hypothetical protein AA106555_2040 [Neokomagataea thailandica NBRC 106555]|uniref:DUF934 domain-containing protein n=2 Tax=Neokomagataea TaxID=1223423 RepID=A0A4Y6V7J7_9PROT|nr:MULTISPECIES: DUF934 domain-containing protein [Neokomagataea]QDH24477.1 DUF934 domain-containing protein [Neokomagataea tanensis]GBR55522.1 hypothetical protein AA106555_2040 [Neokomagataea thailandica NBRC 106555]
MTLFKLGEREPGSYDEPVTLAELAEQGEVRSVVLESADDVSALKPYLNRLALIVLRFPIFRDGRGFTQARELREYLRYGGEIRADGHVLPDQADFLKRCGVDSVDLPEGSDTGPWERQIARYAVSFQRSVLPEHVLDVGTRVAR